MDIKKVNAMIAASQKREKDLIDSLSECCINVPSNLGAKIGVGSMGSVYHYIHDGMEVAVKAFKVNVPNKKIINSVKQLQKVNHENIVKFIGFCYKPASLVFEYCEVAFGEIIIHTYRDLLSNLNEINYFGISDRLNYALQIANGLEYLHNQNIIHKDLKTTNVLVKGTLENIHLKLTVISNDMNIMKTFLTATLTTAKTPNDLKGVQGMTTLYIAPEILVGRMAPTVESDIFAFGFILYETLENVEYSWQNEFPVLNEAVIMNAIKSNKRPSLKCISKLYNGERFIDDYLSVIEKCWAEQANQRCTLDQVIFCVVIYIFIYILYIYKM